MKDRKEVLKTLFIVSVVVILIIVCYAVIQWNNQKSDEKTYLGVTAKSIEEHYGETGQAGWIPEDLNKDGIVNYLDASLFVSNVGG